MQDDTTTDSLLRPAGASGWQIVMLVLSVYVLGALLAETLLELSPETSELLLQMDNWICIVFLGDFFYRLYRAPRKLEFLKWNWIDFLSSIPAWEALRIGRVVRILRVLRALRSAKMIAAYVLRSRSGSLLAATILSFLFVTFAAIAILNLERGPDSNIKSAADALWWAMTTVTTVGYGDRFPVTPEGRIVAVILMVLGAGMFGILSGTVASAFLQHGQNETSDELASLRADLGRLHDQIQFLQNKMGEEDELARLTEEIRRLRRDLGKTDDGVQPVADRGEPAESV